MAEEKSPLLESVQVLLDSAKTISLQLVSERQGQALQSDWEVVGVICQVVEKVSVEIFKDQAATIKGAVKLDLALRIAAEVLEILHSSKVPLMTEATYEKAKAMISNTGELTANINAVVAIAKMSPQIQIAIQEVEDAIDKQCAGCWCWGKSTPAKA